MEHCDQVQRHYEEEWSNQPTRRNWTQGRADQLPREFRILEFGPVPSRDVWTYATCGMSQATDEEPVEIHLFSRVQADSHVELLTAIAHYLRNGEQLGLWHTVNFGRPWLPGSRCQAGLLSVPYLDGPDLEVFQLPGNGKSVRFLWFIPVTADEIRFAKRFGIEALEQKFESRDFNYLDPQRPGVV